jgi:hypothetical protein
MKEAGSPSLGMNMKMTCEQYGVKFKISKFFLGIFFESGNFAVGV